MGQNERSALQASFYHWNVRSQTHVTMVLIEA